MRIALVHDYLNEMAGGERVARILTTIFPGAPLYTSVYDPGACPDFAEVDVRTTFVQHLARRKASTKAVFPVLPVAFRSLRLKGFDVVLSSSSGFAHHVRVPDDAVHVCYCHNPPRFLWQPEDYFRGKPGLRKLLAPALVAFRRLDVRASSRVDAYIANSSTVAGRIRSIYGREAEVMHPPLDTARFRPSTERSGRFLIVSRLLAYKRIDLAVAAATRSGLPLDVIGDGPERARLERLAGPGVRFLGHRNDDFVRHAMARCAALVLPGAEDFGLTPVEAQASGRPPIAFAGGGALETVRDGETGFLFSEESWEAIVEAMRRALACELPAEQLRAWAGQFDASVFGPRLKAFIADQSEAKQRGLRG